MLRRRKTLYILFIFVLALISLSYFIAGGGLPFEARFGGAPDFSFLKAGALIFFGEQRCVRREYVME